MPDNRPQFMYGTAWKEEKTRPLTKRALETGFRAIDTANQRKHYHEAGVGEAISEAIDEGMVDRDELYLQTKFTYEAGQDHRIPYDSDASYDRKVEQSLESSLDHLQTGHVESLVLHGPSQRVGLGDADRTVWRKMEELADGDRVGTIGVSNVTAGQLRELLEFADIAPTYVQNRCFARSGWDRTVRQICDANGIVYQGFSLLTANRSELQQQTIAEIAEKYDKTVPQVVFRFAMEAGMLPLTGTTSETHMRQDLACLEFELDGDDVEIIEQIGT